jgi:glutamate-1-semialdehyde 2,1-aminomutase
MAARLTEGLTEVFDRKEVPSTINRVGSMFTGFFNGGPVASLAQVEQSAVPGHARFFHGMLENGVYLAPSQFEAGFISLAHTEEDIDRTIAAAEAALA